MGPVRSFIDNLKYLLSVLFHNAVSARYAEQEAETIMFPRWILCSITPMITTLICLRICFSLRLVSVVSTFNSYNVVGLLFCRTVLSFYLNHGLARLFAILAVLFSLPIGCRKLECYTLRMITVSRFHAASSSFG